MEGEGNAWFERNQTLLNSQLIFHDISFIERICISFKEDINSICEIGCGNGIKLNKLCSIFNAQGSGVDPSKKAVKSGNELYENLNLKVSTADKLPYDAISFDLVYFGFCLYLVDRNDLYKAVAEADRILKDGGFLAILDFDPLLRVKVPYHHKPGVFSYKNSYANFFINSGHYYLIAKESFFSETDFFSRESDMRISISILYKEPNL